MSEIDPVILELRADLGKYRADLQSTTSQVQRLLGNQEKSAQRLEAQMRKSSGAIGASLRGLAGTLGTYFTGRELTGLIDSFTRLQNSLRVAGLEGAKLESVQTQLLDLSTRYGVGIEGLANLYGKATDAGRSFGASEAEILQMTEATSQALLITGTSAAQAQGAILGLSQALASGTVRAEEYNQINEGGLRPLLQAAAATEKYGGDINKLRTAVLAGKVSSQEFFNAIQTGSAQLAGQASKATLTLSGAFEALTSQLTVYIGQSSQANGVTAALAGALQLLANNLDRVIPALAIIAAGLGIGLVTNAIRARVALLAASGAAVTLAGTATAAGRALLAAFGGPVGVAITALVVGIGYLVSQTDEAVRAAKEAELQAIRTASAQETEKRATELLAAAKGSEKVAQIAATKASRDRAAQALQTAKALQAEAKAALVAARAQARQTFEKSAGDTGFLATFGRALGGAGGAGPTITPGTAQANNLDRKANAAQIELDRANKAIAQLEGQVDGLTAAIGDGAKAPKLAAAAGDGKKPKKGRASSGPSISDINDRFESELASIAQQTISARQSLATRAEDRAELELRAVEAARVEALRSLSADKDYSQAQKARVKDALDNLAEFERERIARDLRVQKEEELADIADTQFRTQSDALRQQYDLAKSQTERRDLAYEIIDLEYRYRDAALRAVEENEDLADAVRQRAAIERAALASGRDRTMESARRDTAGPLENYFDNAKKDAAELNEAYQTIAVDGLGSVRDALTETAAEYLKLGGIAGKVINGIISDLIRLFIQQQITGLVGSLFGPSASSKQGAASGIAAGVGKFFGRASGGYNAPHSITRVNEQGGGVELLRMGSKGGTVIPLGQVNQQASRDGGQSGGVTTVRLELSGDIDARIDQRSAAVSVEVVRAAAPSLIQGAVGETQRQMSRPRMPGAGR